MPIDFEFFKDDDNDSYYAVVSKGSMVFSSASNSFVKDDSVSYSDAVLVLSSGNLNRLYGSIGDQYLSDGIYAIRIYKMSSASPSVHDELIACENTGWSQALGGQCDPSNVDDLSTIISTQNLPTRGYSVRMTGQFLGNSNPEIGIAEMFISKKLGKCLISMSVYPTVVGINYTHVSVRTNDGNRTIIQEVKVTNNAGNFEIEFAPSAACIPYLMNGNFILGLSSGANAAPRIAGNPENKSVSSIPGVPNISFERNVTGTGISFRSV